MKKFGKKSNVFTSEVYLFLFLIALLLIMAIFANGFFSINNIMSVLNSYAYILIAAIGMQMIIITSNIDISTGALISVICIVLAMIGKLGLPFAVLLPVAMLVGLILSTINGLFVTKLKIPAMVATLATAQLFQGILPLIVEGSIYDLPESFTWLAFEAKVFKIIPLSVIMCLIIVLIFLPFMKYSKFSKKIYAIGNNKEGARLAGINVDKTIVQTYAIAGALFGISAVIIATAGQRVTTTMGSGLEMTLIAAVVLGGTNTAGGSGKVIGTVIGALILAIVTPAVNYLGISANWSDAIKGIIIIVSVVLNALRDVEKKRDIGVKYIRKDSEKE